MKRRSLLGGIVAALTGKTIAKDVPSFENVYKAKPNVQQVIEEDPICCSGYVTGYFYLPNGGFYEKLS